MNIFDTNKLKGSSSTVNFHSSALREQHTWVTVINPSNHRLLLQACDDCGVVKSENSIIRPCRAVKGQELISKSMRASFCLVS